MILTWHIAPESPLLMGYRVPAAPGQQERAAKAGRSYRFMFQISKPASIGRRCKLDGNGAPPRPEGRAGQGIQSPVYRRARQGGEVAANDPPYFSPICVQRHCREGRGGLTIQMPETLIVCARVADLTEPPFLSRQRTCCSCYERVWVSVSMPHHADCLCERCYDEALAEGVEAA